MATRIDMPQLGLTMEKGTILQWLKAEGEAVEKGQPVVLIQTEKVEYEVESPGAGTLLKVVAAEGAEIPVGGLMAVLGQPGENVSSFVETGAESLEPRAARPEAPASSPQPRASEVAPVRAPGERVKISPAARKLAQDHGIDIAGLTPTGPEGRIVREDVERAIAARTAGPAAGRGSAAARTPDVIPLAGIRKVIFDRMGQSWREAARVTLFAEADLTEIVALRQAKGSDWERRFGVKPSYSDLIHMAVARALREEPRINCRLDGQSVRIRREVHLSFAVDLGEGLVAAVIKDADKKTLGELARAARDLAERARAGKLLPDEMGDGTFTVSNLGGVGVEAFTPIINPPQAGILGVGKILEKPVVRNGGIHIRSMMMLSLVFDHRLVDGAPAGRFLAKVKDLLENPAWIQ
ncbi:MAG TPA: dihydrolipoamide acetyltransferase family protein [Candidatus Methylomirabilis sp.]|nr:dihydrolipoamide acetyltransferase family protein [Candidatus Methylomirabilis sp.]